ncbi:MAG: hypothetical protein GC200_07790 [Tepidisphaera sp.]|nr:hypothetical protein [Tepidisphaera sp.]
MKKTSMLAALAGLAMVAGAASAQVFSSSPFAQISDLTTTSDTINVSGGPSNITNVNVIVQITHTWDSDIDMVLQGPNGYIALATDNGGSGDNMFTTRFTDGATTGIGAGTAPFDGNFKPIGTTATYSGPETFSGTQYSAMSGFSGSDSNGAWTLYIYDDAGGDVGTLQYWSMEFNYASDPNDPNSPPPPPTVPSGVGSITAASIPTGGMTGFRVAVTPAINPTSTGLSVSVDASSIGLGTINLLDDGINDDGVAGNNVFGQNVTVNAAPGDYVLSFNVTDAQSRSSTGNFPNLNIQTPAPSCPEGLNAVSFSNVDSFDGPGAGGNTFLDLGWTSTSDIIQTVHVSGRLIQDTPFTYASEARIRLHYTDGSFDDIQTFTDATWTGPLDQFDYAYTLPTPRHASDIVNAELFESFNDVTGAADSTWVALCLTYDALTGPTDPTAVGSATPSVLGEGDSTHFSVTVTPGLNPDSTNLAVTLDGSSIGLGSIQLLDDGVNDDGIPGNNVFGANASVPTGTSAGDYTLGFTVTDAQSRSAFGSIPVTVLPPVPACPDYSQPQSFSNLISDGAAGNGANSFVNLNFTGTEMATELHVSGRLVSQTAFTWPNDARLRISFSDGSFEDLVVFTEIGGFTTIDANDVLIPFAAPHAANTIVGMETFEIFDDTPGPDAIWQGLCVAYKASNTNPVITAASITPANTFPDVDVQFSATVVPGANPTSTGLTANVDAGPIGGGTITLLDDGIHDDGIAGNGVFGGTYHIPAGAAGGVYTLNFNANDAEGRFANQVTADVTINAPAQWEESIQGGGDAGETPDTAQVVSGSGTIDTIGGSIDNGGADSDLFAIDICDPSSFSATTAGGTGTLTDTQLWLFKADGTGVEFNDDTVGVRSSIDNSFVFDPGTYLIGVSGYNRDAVDSDGSLIWNNTPFTTVRAPDGPGAFNPVSSWTGTSATGTYQITLTGACYVSGGPACDPDYNQDGVADQGDVDYLINAVAGGDNPTGRNLDFNNDGVADQGDVDALVNVIAGGNCP